MLIAKSALDIFLGVDVTLTGEVISVPLNCSSLKYNQVENKFQLGQKYDLGNISNQIGYAEFRETKPSQPEPELAKCRGRSQYKGKVGDRTILGENLWSYCRSQFFLNCRSRSRIKSTVCRIKTGCRINCLTNRMK